MTFRSTRIRNEEGDRYTLEGKLTVKNVTKDVLVPFTFYGVQENPFNKEELVAGFEGQLTIDRLEYHVGSGKYYKMGVTGKDVNIFISLEMLKQK
jgi:polyisoprenoid-binding protein YceI